MWFTAFLLIVSLDVCTSTKIISLAVLKKLAKAKYSILPTVAFLLYVAIRTMKHSQKHYTVLKILRQRNVKVVALSADSILCTECSSVLPWVAYCPQLDGKRKVQVGRQEDLLRFCPVMMECKCYLQWKNQTNFGSDSLQKTVGSAVLCNFYNPFSTELCNAGFPLKHSWG